MTPTALLLVVAVAGSYLLLEVLVQLVKGLREHLRHNRKDDHDNTHTGPGPDTETK